MFVRTLSLALLLSASAAYFKAAAAEKRKEVPPTPPALPVPQEVQVLRGEEREIVLKIYGRKNQPITFLIRKPPRFGQITPPTNTEAEVAIVRYRPPDDRKITRDSFQYAARSGEGVSAAVTVDIRIVDTPAQLSVTQELTFPQCLTGTVETQVVEMENVGGNFAEGEAFVDPPWKIEGASLYRIEPHGRGFLRVRFAPEKSGRFQGEVRFSSQTDRVTTLRGTAVDAIEVSPPLLSLQPELTTLVRAGAVEITNHTDAPLTVRAAASQSILVEEEMTLAPGEARPVIIRTVAGEASQLNGKVTFEAGAFRAELPVTADPLPAVIRPSEALVNFGQLPAGPSPQFEFTLQNLGGKPGTATIVGYGPLRAPTQPISLAPGQVVQVPIAINARTNGMVDASLEVRAPSGVTRVPVRGGVGVNVPRLASAPAATVAKQNPKSETATDEPLPWSPYETDLQQPVDQRKIIRVTGLGPNRCSLEWSKELSKADRFVAEIRQLAFAEGKLVENWRPHAAFRVERVAERFRGTIEGLEPQRLYTLRVRSQEKGSAPGPVVFQTAFTTPLPQQSSSKPGWKTAVAVFGFIWLAVFYWKRRRRAAAPATFDARKTQKIFD